MFPLIKSDADPFRKLTMFEANSEGRSLTFKNYSVFF